MAALHVDALNYLIVIPLYIALICTGLKLIHLSVKKKAITEENESLKRELYQEKLKHEQLRNCNSIMRLLRQLHHSFSDRERLKAELAQLVIEINAYTYQWVWIGDKSLYESKQIRESIYQLINNHDTIKSLTAGFDMAELILRKSQSSYLEPEDKEILKTEFTFIYGNNCKRAIECLQVLKKPILDSKLVPYELLDCAHTIEMLENYFDPLLV